MSERQLGLPQTHAKLTQDDLVARQQFCKCLKRMVASGYVF
jgi:hypothetical protein